MNAVLPSRRHAHSFDRWIESRVAAVAVLVDPLPLGVGLDRVADADARVDRLLRGGERARGDAAEERRAVGGALLDRRALDRDPEHGGDDLQPELAAGAAARRAADAGLDPERAQELERVAQPVGDALEDGPDECAAVMSEGQSLEHGPGVRVRMGRPLALEVRQERQPLGARRPARRLGDELVVRLADHVAQPLGASRRRRASRPSPPRCPGRRGRRRGRVPRGSAR